MKIKKLSPRMSKTREFDTGRLLALREEQGFIASIIIDHQMP
jgi:hypothetical protein